MSQLFEDVQYSLHGIAIAPRSPLVKVTLMKVISMDFNFDRRTKKLCCAAFIDRKIDHGIHVYNSFFFRYSESCKQITTCLRFWRTCLGALRFILLVFVKGAKSK